MGTRDGAGEERMMTVPEVAAYLNVSVSSIYRAVRQGSLPSYQIMGSVRVKPRDLETYLRRSGGSPPPASLEAAQETLGLANLFGLKHQDPVPAQTVRWFCTLESYARQESRLEAERPWHEARTIQDYIDANKLLERFVMLIPRQFRENSEHYLTEHVVPDIREMRRDIPFELSAGFFGLDAPKLEGFGLLTSSVLVFDATIARIFPIPPTPLPVGLQTVDLGVLYPYAMTLDAAEPHFAAAIGVFTETFDYIFERLEPADVFTIRSAQVQRPAAADAAASRRHRTGEKQTRKEVGSSGAPKKLEGGRT